MNSFDDELKKALERKQPSADFTARVLAAVSAEEVVQGNQKPVRRGLGRWWLPVWLAPVAAMLVVMLGVGYQQHRARVQGEQAKEKLMIALRLTGAKLQEAQAKVADISEKRGVDK